MGFVAAPVVTMKIGKIGQCICIAPRAGASGKVTAAAVRTSTTWTKKPDEPVSTRHRAPATINLRGLPPTA